MKETYQNILNAIGENQKLLALLIDPEKVVNDTVPSFINKVNNSVITHIFIGGSTDKNNRTKAIVKHVKQYTKLPIVLFPGDYTQLAPDADSVLFLSLISGRNPEYLIEQHVQAIPLLKKMDLEIIPTGYILLDGGIETAVQRVSNTQPLHQKNIDLVVHTALAGEYSGKKLIYLEAGSGAKIPVNTTIIKAVKSALQVPLIVGGGIRTKKQLAQAYEAGADLVVIGTAFEKDESFFNELKK